MTPLLRSYVDSETYWNFSKGDLEERPWSPRPIPPAQRKMAERALAELNAYLEPVDRKWLAGRIVSLRAHFWTPDTPDLVREARAGDWITVLCDLPKHAIERACIEWLKTQKWEPKSSEIRALAESFVGNEVRDRRRLEACLHGGKRGGLQQVGDAL